MRHRLAHSYIIGERRSGLPCWRRDAVKKHRAMPYAIWPHRAYGQWWNTDNPQRLKVSTGDAAFHHETQCRSSVFFITIAWYGFLRPFRHSPMKQHSTGRDTADSVSLHRQRLAFREWHRLIFSDLKFSKSEVNIANMSWFVFTEA